jgi:[acyl-carrier-protein] S-malonyltransferase
MSKKFALVFPGQGAQSVGMVEALAAEFPQIRARFTTAAQVLGLDLWQLVSVGPTETLNKTEHTQPALLAASVAIWDIWLGSGGPRPALMAGHSFGEYSALVCAGALAFEDAVTLVAARGRLMQEAVSPGAGAMAAVLGLDLPALERVCADAADNEVVECANLNAPGQIVISGSAGAVLRASELAKSRGAKKVIPLAVSVPAHCALMLPAARKFSELVTRVPFSPPQIPVIHNADVATHEQAAQIRAALVAQLAQPVRWQATIERFASEGVVQALECGPGKVLGPLIRRCASEISTTSLGTPADLRGALESLTSGN